MKENENLTQECSSRAKRRNPQKQRQAVIEGLDDYELHSIDEVIAEAEKSRVVTRPGHLNSESCQYYDVAAAFDIEASSWYEDDEKKACMYCWQFAVNGRCCFGRTWQEFMLLMDTIKNTLKTGHTKRFVIYVHNLSYEFVWLEKRLNFVEFSTVDDGRVYKAVTSDGIEFRCSYILTGKSLAEASKELVYYHIEKLTGDLDYDLIRHSKTPMTQQEIKYCLHDVKCVCAIIQEKMDRDKNIVNIPGTRTGYVRKLFRRRTIDGTAGTYYRKVVQSLKLTPELYDMCRKAYAGGDTACSFLKSGELCYHVASYDETSAYPTVMVAEKFPMSNGVKVKIESLEQFNELRKDKLMIFDVKFFGLRIKPGVSSPTISRSHCWGELKGEEEFNGRIAFADSLCTTMTNIDFDTFEYFYDYDGMKINNCWVFEKQYLPSQFVDVILELYEKKTQLKGVEGKELDYQLAKGDLNASYGMMCQRVVYGDNVAAELEKYNNNERRFTWYVWALFITSYARRNLRTAIYNAGKDFIYSDTDSVKIMNHERHKDFFDRYDKWITGKLEKAMKYHNFSVDRIRPKTIQGVEKPLGVWDFEGVYDKFKAIRSKAYMTQKNGEITLTMSGVNKVLGSQYMSQQKDPFLAFSYGLTIPAEYTGKLTHAYGKYHIEGTVTDYLGNTGKYSEEQFVHMEPVEYTMSECEEFFAFIEYVMTRAAQE